MIKKATQVGNPIIRSKAKTVLTPGSKAMRKIVKDLTDSMRHHNLVGMAAPQIGQGHRIFVTELRKTAFRRAKKLDRLRVFLNPKIKSFSRKSEIDWEGCGSVAAANLFGLVKRPYSVVIEAWDMEGNKFDIAATGFFARVLQHELDHLHGRVFTDLADPKTFMSKSEYLKMRRKESMRTKNKPAG